MLHLRSLGSLRSLIAVSVVSAGIAFVAAGGCTSPARNTTGTAGAGSPGTAGNGSPGTAGTSATGSAGDNGVGAGGQGNEIITITGSAGMGGTAGDGGPGTGGNATTGSAGSGTSGSAGVSGSAGSTGGGKVACGSATADPLAYTGGSPADPPTRNAAMSLAMQMTDAEKSQQMSGLPQSGSANYNVFKQEDNTSRSIRAFWFRDGPRGVNLSANSDNKSDYSTAFPVAIARGAAFDDQLEFQIGQAIGDE